jgi:predicted AlkP superfamily pyrophosphatase or phosphodiesterase
MIPAGIVTREDVETFGSKNIVLRDHIWTEAAAHIIRVHKPNLMMFHLLTLDSVQHRYGPDTLAAQSTMAHLDDQVGAIVHAVEEAGIGDRTTFFVVSDHGFKRVKRQINPNVALSRKVWHADERSSRLTHGSCRRELSDCPVTAPDSDTKLGTTAAALGGIEGIDSRLSHPTTRRWGCRFLLERPDG